MSIQADGGSGAAAGGNSSCSATPVAELSLIQQSVNDVIYCKGCPECATSAPPDPRKILAQHAAEVGELFTYRLWWKMDHEMHDKWWRFLPKVITAELLRELIPDLLDILEGRKLTQDLHFLSPYRSRREVLDWVDTFNYTHRNSPSHAVRDLYGLLTSKAIMNGEHGKDRPAIIAGLFKEAASRSGLDRLRAAERKAYRALNAASDDTEEAAYVALLASEANVRTGRHFYEKEVYVVVAEFINAA